jgi:UDP-N-acetyl-D-glucosamine dehydrogenase
VVVIAVPTPLTKDRKPDLAFVEAACKTIGENLKDTGTDYQ